MSTRRREPGRRSERNATAAARLPALVLLALAAVASAIGAPLPVSAPVPVVDDPPVYAPTPEERAERVAELMAAAKQRPIPYYHVPADVVAGDDTETTSVQRRSSFDPDAMLRTFNGNGGDGSPRAVFDAFLSDVVNQAASDGSHGEAVARAIHDTDWGDQLIRATIETLDAYGPDAPKAIKELLRRGPRDGIGMEYAKLMWMARDLLVRRSLDTVITRLSQDYPGMRFEINILDSGSYESIGSDIDKTLHLVAWDADGTEVKTFGQGGRIMGGNIDDFIRLVYTEFNATGRLPQYGAGGEIRYSLDTEFFRSDTLRRRHTFGATHSTSVDALNATAARLREAFAALQTNPLPSYQFDGKVDTQVVGRTVETDARLQGEIDGLAERRGRIDQLGADDVRALVLDEMIRSVHAPAIAVSRGEDGLEFRRLNVVEFLERNNLTIVYDPATAAENALGDYEKIRHKRHKVIRADGSFDADAYDLYRNDIAKYDTRISFDSATVKNPDDGPRPVAFGEFARRYGPAGARQRFGLANDPPNQRSFTYEVFREAMLPALERMYRSRGLNPDAVRPLVQADLELLWAGQRVSETLMAIKENPGLADPDSPDFRYPPGELYRPLLEYMDDREVVVVPDPAEGPEAFRARRLEAAKRLHMEASDRRGVLLGTEDLQVALNRWLGGADDYDFRAQYDTELEAGQKRIWRLEGELDDLQRRPPPEDPARARARQGEIEVMQRRIAATRTELLAMANDFDGWRASTIGASHDLVRRIVELFAIQGNDPALRQILDSVEPRFRTQIEYMAQVWAGSAEERALRLAALQAGMDEVDLFTATRRWSADVARRLGYSYAQAFGVDTDAYLRRGAPPANAANINAPHRVFGRFFVNNYMNRGAFDSALRLLRAMQQSEDMPWEVRASMMAEAASAEAIGPIPVIGPLYATWTGFRAGEPMLVAGGGMQMAAEIMQHLSEAGAVAEYSNLVVLALSMARTGVEIVGHEAFAPVRDHYFQLAYQGYVNPQASGFIRAGTLEADSRLPITPIVEPDVGKPLEFIYLNPDDAQRFLGELRAAGQSEPAVTLLRLAGRDENLGDRLDDVPGGLLIDLRTDFDALIAQADSHVAAFNDLPDGVVQRLRRARDQVVELWSRMATLQRVVRGRIDTDRERRDDSGGTLNLWLMASRQNLALRVEEQLDAQVQLLYQHLAGDPDIAEVFVAEAERAWAGWQARSPSFVDPEVVRGEFERTMQPHVAHRERLRGLRSQIGGLETAQNAADVPAGEPVGLLGRYLSEQIIDWMQIDTIAQQRDRQIRQLQQPIAAMAAFANNSYVNRPAVLPSDAYRLDQVTAWFGDEIRGWQASLIDIPRRPDLTTAAPLVELILGAEERLARMKTEHGLVMQGFAEADTLVAPKVAQLLLMEWIAGEGRYDNEVNAMLDFLWHDAQTQARIRDTVAGDLVNGRQLLRRHRVQAMTFEGMLDTAIADARREAIRLAQDAYNQRLREAALQVLGKEDKEIAPYQAFSGDLQLRAEPYLFVEGDQLQVGVSARVDHDVYRAVEVELKWGYDVLAPDQLDAVVGAEAVERALQVADLERDEILAALRVNVAVTEARAAAPFKEIEYTGELPHSDNHLLLIPGKVDRPLVPADPALDVCVLRADAPEDLPDEDAIDYCDPAITQPTRFDRVAVFFTPERDLRIPTYDQQLFAWRIWHESDRTLRSGDFVGDRLTEEEYDTYHANVIPLAKEGSPGAFAVIMPGWERIPESGYGRRGLGPGAYTVQTRRTQLEAGAGLFGQGDPGITYDSEYESEWRDEMTFEIFDASLKFRGFVTEQVKEAVWPEVPGIWSGQFTLLDPEVSGAMVTLGAEATWQEIADPEDEGTTWYADPEEQERAREREENAPPAPPRPDPEVHRIESRLTMEFPEELLPGHELMGQVGVQLRGEPQDPFVLVAGMHLLVPGSGEPPDRHLAQGEASLPGPWAEEGLLADEYCSGAADQFDQEVTDSEPSGVTIAWVWPRLTYWYRCSGRAARSLDATITLHGGEPELLAGEPARPLGNLMRDESTLWVVPVFFQLSDGAGLTTPGEGLKMRAYGYAIYGPEATPYAGATPRDGPETGEGREPVADADDGDTEDGDGDGNTGDDTGDTDATDPGTDPATGDPGTGDPGTADPGTGDPEAGDTDTGYTDTGDGDPDADAPPPGGIVPSDPDTAALIREWLTVARPPDNVIAGADVRYSHRGRMIGTVPGGIIRHPEAENLAFDPTYLWVNFRTNDSVDHCTMEEFVQARVSGEPTAHCAGRYREVLDVVGQPATEARSQLQAEGMQVDVRVAEAAPSAELAYTVADQKPGARTAATRGSRIEIGVYGEHSAALTAPDVIGLPAADARDRLEAAGLVAEVVIGDEAPAADRTYTVYDQNPGAGVGLAAGGTVQLSIYSDYRPRTRVPYLGGSTVQEARQQLTDLGLSPVQGETVPAYSNESEGLVADTSPGEGVEVDRGTEVQLLTYGQFTHPRCEELLRDGRGAASSNLDRARSLLVEARDLDCPSDGIDASIADLDDRIAQRDRCNALVAQGGQQEQAGNLQGARATYRQALSSGCTNPGLSDAIARIDSTIRDSERERLCNEAIARGNAQWNAGNLAGARATYRQARADGCTNSGLDDGIAGIESAIRDQQQRERERLERERRERDDRVTVPHWVLVETRINPTREPTDFVVGVTPNFYSDRNNGSFRRWSVGETNMTYSSRWQDHGYLELDVSIGVDFTGPPAQLVPGQTVNLSATFSHRGTVNSGNPGIAFEYRGDGIGVSGPAGHTYSPWAPEFRGVSSISPNFQVPAVHGGQIALTAFLWNCGACNVTWVYEARQPEPPPPPVDTIVPPVDTGSGTGPGPFSVVVGVYLPFNQQDAGTGDARGAIESRLNDVSQWVLAIPLMLDIGGDAVRAYSRSAFTPGSRWSMPIGVQAQLVDGQSGTMNGALLLEVVGVYDNPAAAMAAQPAVQQAGDPLRFRAGDGRMRQQLDRDGNASTITGGPLQTGWSTQAQQGARQLLLEMMQNFDLCFVATAVYESREGEPLDRLRRFRDEVLLQSPAGRRLAMLYYRSGPALAGWVNRNPAIRPLLRPVVDALGSALDTVAGNPTLSAALDLVLRTLAPTFDPLPLDPGRPATARSFSPWPLPWLQPPTDDDSTQESSR